MVEGQHDIDRLHRLFDCDAVATHGLGLDEATVQLIRTLAADRGVIVMTDPDHAGETIRRLLDGRLDNCRQAFVAKSQAIGRRNVGIEYATDQALREALDHAVTLQEDRHTLSWAEYGALGAIGSAARRQAIADAFHLGHANNKTLFKRLNMIGVGYGDVIQAVGHHG